MFILLDTATDLTYEGATLWLMMLTGWAIGHFKIWNDNFMLPLQFLNQFVFYISIPAAAFQAMASQDFFLIFQNFWRFIIAILCLRIFAGIIVAFCTIASGGDLKSFVNHYIGTTWMNTIVFGIPMLTAIYGKSVQPLLIYASLSSFSFQLPFMLFCLEVHKALTAYKQSHPSADHMANQHLPTVILTEPPINNHELDHPSLMQEGAIPNEASVATSSHTLSTDSLKVEIRSVKAAEAPSIGQPDHYSHWEVLLNREFLIPTARQIALGIVKTPPIIGIVLGLLWSLILTSSRTANWAYPPIVSSFTTYFGGNTVTPLPAFVVGLFINGEYWRRLLKNRTYWRVLLYLIAKLMILPMLCIPIVLMMGLTGVQARSAIFVASLPVALSGFTIAKEYSTGQDEQSAVIVLGTVLCMPTLLAWQGILDYHNAFI